MIVTLKKGCSCSGCGKNIYSGDMAYKYRRQRKVFCWKCGNGDSKGFFGQLWQDVKFIVKEMVK